jgi:hypothetical protein
MSSPLVGMLEALYAGDLNTIAGILDYLQASSDRIRAMQYGAFRRAVGELVVRARAVEEAVVIRQANHGTENESDLPDSAFWGYTRIGQERDWDAFCRTVRRIFWDEGTSVHEAILLIDKWIAPNQGKEHEDEIAESP